MIIPINASAEKQQIASSVLYALPQWFGLPESTTEYIRESASMPFWADMANGTARGFIVLRETSPYAAEIYVMGVLPQYHHQGIGRSLFQALHAYAKDQGYAFLQVKTVQQGHYTEYDTTNVFYRSMGFRELECFPTLWDENNPCQILIMSIN